MARQTYPTADHSGISAVVELSEIAAIRGVKSTGGGSHTAIVLKGGGVVEVATPVAEVEAHWTADGGE